MCLFYRKLGQASTVKWASAIKSVMMWRGQAVKQAVEYLVEIIQPVAPLDRTGVFGLNQTLQVVIPLDYHLF